jgi:outer membrane immunogenic protein
MKGYIMKKFQLGALTAVALVMGVTAQSASAQSASFHADAQVGYSRFSAAGDKDGHIGYGAAVGADFDMGGFFVGGEGTFWWAPAEVNTIDGAGLVNHKTFQEWGLGLRAGVNVMPGTKVYGKVAYVRNEQRKRFTPLPGVCGGNACQTAGYYDHYKVGGFQYAAGVEQAITNNLYIKAEGRYSDYKSKLHSGGTHTVTGLLGLGVMFGGVAPAPVMEVAPPPPAPVEAAPATQTCPDGSVILATSTCPPPPPPPPAPVERGERG